MRGIAFLIFCFFSLQTTAQFKVIAEGPVFTEPEEGYAKIINMKNGNTIFLHVTKKHEFSVQVYTAAHKKKIDKTVDPSFNTKRVVVEAAFEVGGDLAIFVMTGEGRIPELNRIIIDGKSGNLKKNESIAQLSKVTMGQGYAMVFGGVPPPSFYIRKDPYSDNYAVAAFNSFESDRNKRIEIIYFDGSHKQLARSFYNSPEEKYKYLVYADMAIIGAEKVCILTYGYNTASSGGKESALLMATLYSGDKNLKMDELDLAKNLTTGVRLNWFNNLGMGAITFALTRYNPVTKKLMILTSAKRKKEKEYESYIAIINPANHSIEYSSTIYPSKANAKQVEVFGSKSEYKGMPQNLFINDDGSFTIVYEEITVIHRVAMNSNANSITSDLNNLAISKFDKDANEIATYLIPKSHKVWNAIVSPYYHSDREGSAQLLSKGNQFKSFAYLNGKENSFILFNDAQSNTESSKKGKITTIQGVSDSDGFLYKLSGDQIFLNREFVFGKPDDKKTHNLALFAISDYDRENDVYVTLKLENERGNKGVKVVWLKPQ